MDEHKFRGYYFSKVPVFLLVKTWRSVQRLTVMPADINVTSHPKVSLSQAHPSTYYSTNTKEGNSCGSGGLTVWLALLSTAAKTIMLSRDVT